MNAKELQGLLIHLPPSERESLALLYDPKPSFAGESGWYFHGHPITQAQALDLIVGACKRKMEEDWMGCCASFARGRTSYLWDAAYRAPSGEPMTHSAPTEPAAVIAAWRAWKEAGK